MTIPRSRRILYLILLSRRCRCGQTALDVQEIITVCVYLRARAAFTASSLRYVEEDGQEQILQVSNIGVTDEAGQF